MPPLASLLFAAVLAAVPGNAYQAVFMRAAPGHLLHLIDAIKARMPVYQAAGFESRNHIGPYLRQFLSGHHDTLGSVVR